MAVSSGGMYQTKLNTDDLQSADDYDGVAAYCKAKRATVDVMEQWAKRPPPNGTGMQGPGDAARSPGPLQALGLLARLAAGSAAPPPPPPHTQPPQGKEGGAGR